MNVSSWSIKNPIAAIMAFILLSLAGLLSFSKMKVQNFPDLDVPNITILATLPGAAPNQLESEIARKVENAISSLQGLKHTHTKIQDGAVSITAEFRIEKDTQEALDEVRSAVNKIRGDLPSSMNEPVINKLDMAAGAVLAYALSSPRMDEEALSWFVENDISKALLAVKGVGAVNRVGGVAREILVELDPNSMDALGATAADVSRQLAQVQIERAGGKSKINNTDQPLRTLALQGNAEQLAGLLIPLSDGRHIRLDQIAHIKDQYAERTAAAFLNGKAVVGFEVARSKGASEIEVGKGVRAKLKALQELHPDLVVTESFDFVTPVQEEFDGSMQLLYEGAILAVLVVWLFLRDLRATVVSAIALPLSVIPAFIGMEYMGFSINVVTLLSLSLVVGILVDDAIVEVENIVRHMGMGKSPYRAAMEAADEIGLAVIATTFALIAVFLPTAFMTGIPGKFFKQFGWTACFAVFASLMVARMLTPIMSAYVLKAIGGDSIATQLGTARQQPTLLAWFKNIFKPHHGDPSWMPVYMRIVTWCLTHRWITCILAMLFFVGSVMLIPLLPQGFIPPDDNSQTQVYLELPPGSTLQNAIDTSEQARKMVSKLEHVASVYTTIGSGSAGADPFAPRGVAEVRKAALTIQLDPRGKRPRKQVIEGRIREVLHSLAGARIKVGLGGTGEKYQLVLSGSDGRSMATAAQALERDLRSIPGVGGIESTASLVRTEISILPDFAKAADMGVTSAAIADTLRVATTGDFDSQVAKLNLPERQVPIVVKLAPEGMKSLETLARLAIPSAKGSVMLGQIAQLQFSGGPASIDRYDRERNISFTVELAEATISEVREAVTKFDSIKNLPAGVRVIETGDAEVQGELFMSFGLAMITGVVCIYMVLVLLFKDFLQPITILAALPLSLGGAFVGLLLADKSFSMPSLIGLIMLMGVATKNSILLVEYAIVSRRTGITRTQAMLDACHKRARPIVMTTIAMGAGMLPIALGLGSADTSFRAPMSIAVIGGLITSTFLSLLVIPPVYTIVDDLAGLLRRLFRGNANSAPDQELFEKRGLTAATPLAPAASVMTSIPGAST